VQVQPYLSFDGRCDEAIAFYQKALGAEVQMLMRWKDAPDKSMCTPTNADKVMHSQIRIGDTVAMASDGRNTGHPEFKGFSLAISAKDASEVDRMFGALSEGGQITMPLTETFFSPRFGMVADKFGVQWMLLVAK
jgi:PhnB protein